MRKLVLLAGAALAVSASPAAAQILGGNVGGNVSGNVGVGVSRPDLGVRDTLRDTRDFGRDAVRSTRDALPEVEGRVTGRAESSSSARPQRLSTQTDVTVGTEVRARNGDVIGAVTGVTRDARGYVRTVLVRTSDGAVRALPAASADLQVDGSAQAVVSRWDARRLQRERPVEQPGRTVRDDRASGDRERTVAE